MVADAIGDVLADAGINVTSGGDDNDANITAQFADGVFSVDIPAASYERGSGYCWKKIPGVVFTPAHIVLFRLDPDPASFPSYTDDGSSLDIGGYK